MQLDNIKLSPKSPDIVPESLEAIFQLKVSEQIKEKENQTVAN